MNCNVYDLPFAFKLAVDPFCLALIIWEAEVAAIGLVAWRRQIGGPIYH